MSDELLEQLRRENPVPDQMAALPFESMLARIDDHLTAGDRQTTDHRETIELTETTATVTCHASGLAGGGEAGGLWRRRSALR